MIRRTVSLAATLVVCVAAPAGAHFVTVKPAGGENCVVRHVGQLPPGHNSMGGHTAASTHEQSAVVTFGRPGTCA